MSVINRRDRVEVYLLTAVFASILLLLIVVITQNAFAMGAAPSTCNNRYDSGITRMTLNNGTQTFDPIANPGLRFRADINSGFTHSMTLRTVNSSSNGNQYIGTTWYSEHQFGFANGHCTNPIGANEDMDIDYSIQWNYAG